MAVGSLRDRYNEPVLPHPPLGNNLGKVLRFSMLLKPIPKKVRFTFRQGTKGESVMSAEMLARNLGIEFPEQTPGYLNMCIRSGNLLLTSGHVSTAKGILGKNMTVEEGYEAAKDCAIKILQSIHHHHGTLDGLRVLRLLGCVYSDPNFTDQHLVINGASDLLHQIFGKDGDGYHARSALGYAALPTGAAVEIEAIFEVKE